MSNEMSAVIATLTAQFNSINARVQAEIAERDKVVADYKTKIDSIVTEAKPLAAALAALGVVVKLPEGLSTSNGPKRVMSEEAKERIRQGLARAREAKAAQATVAAPQAPMTAPAPVAATVPSTEAKTAKSGKRGNK